MTQKSNILGTGNFEDELGRTTPFEVHQNNKLVVKFLDYEIINTGNGDGWVLTKPEGELYECNLGNFTKLDTAKRYAVQYFMVARPQFFASHAVARMNGKFLYFDYYAFIRVLRNLNMEAPPEISCSDDSNSILTFNGEKI